LREGNTAHAHDCKYHSDRLNSGPAPVIAIPDEEDEEEDGTDGTDNESDDDIESSEDESEDDSEEETVAAAWKRRIHRL
jgi:hypothetical protein